MSEQFERLTRKIGGGLDPFGMPCVGTYEMIDQTPGLTNVKARCQLGRYEDSGLSPARVQELAEAERDGRLEDSGCDLSRIAKLEAENRAMIDDIAVLKAELRTKEERIQKLEKDLIEIEIYMGEKAECSVCAHLDSDGCNIARMPCEFRWKGKEGDA
jgi:hypothetical protein